MGYAIFQMMRCDMVMELEAYLSRVHERGLTDLRKPFFGRYDLRIEGA